MTMAALLEDYPEEAFEEIDIDKPVKGIAFIVHTLFNEDHRSVRVRLRQGKENHIESDGFATYPEAMDAADGYANAIQQQFRGAEVHKIESDDMEDEFHIFITDKMKVPIAKIAVVAADYREATIH